MICVRQSQTLSSEDIGYVKGEILLFTDGKDDDGRSVAEEAAKFLDGEIIEKLESVPVYRVRVLAGSRGELDALCTSVMEQGIDGLSGAMIDAVFKLESDAGDSKRERKSYIVDA